MTDDKERMLEGLDSPRDCPKCGDRLAVVNEEELKCFECNKRYDR